MILLFDLLMSNHEVVKRLQSRSIGEWESLFCDFIGMPNIAQQGKFEEAYVVKYTVDGHGNVLDTPACIIIMVLCR